MSRKNKISVLIPDGESILSLPVVRCLAQEPRIEINVISDDRYAPIRYSRLINSYDYFTKNSEKLSFLLETVSKRKIDVILPVDISILDILIREKNVLEDYTRIAPIPDNVKLSVAKDKWFSAEYFAQNDFPHPKTYNLSDANIKNLINSLVYPILVKPRIGYFGYGIKKIDSSEDLEKITKNENIIDKFIVQEYIQGYDIDCSVLSKDGEILVFTMQKGILKGRSGFGPAGAVEFVYDQNVFELVKTLVKKLKWNGVLHIDLRYDQEDGTFKILEMNPRYWGTLLGSLNAGINFPYLACIAAMGEKIKIENYLRNYYLSPEHVLNMFKEKYLVRSSLKKFKFNSGFKYLLTDPLPEIIGSFSEMKRQKKINSKSKS